MKIEEILALPTIEERISYLKKGRKTPLPDKGRLYNDWDANLHEIKTDKAKYPDIKIKTQMEQTVFDENTGKSYTIPEKTKTVEPNRIVIPLEQDIVNIHTAFTVGTEPAMECNPEESEKGLFSTLKRVLDKNKIKYQNKRIVRSWLSEQECAEYWYTTEDNEGFWNRILAKLGVKMNVKPQHKLKSVLWSPFRGDTLYPFFNEKGDMVAFSREYKRKTIKDIEVSCFMVITAENVHLWELSSETTEWTEQVFKHGFKKLPVMYCYRSEALCDKIHSIRVRLEKLLSSYADCIDYHFFPILKLFGDLDPNTTQMSGDMRNRVVQLTGQGANAEYLTWNQASETVKLELESLTEKAYSMTNTPRVMPEALHTLGTSFSGVSFRYMFMGAHLAVENHAEEIGEFMQRRVNFLISAISSINTSFEKAAQTIDIDVQIQPYMIDSEREKIDTAVAAVDGGVWTRREGIVFAGNADMVEENLREIEEEKAEKQEVAKIGFNTQKE